MRTSRACSRALMVICDTEAGSLSSRGCSVRLDELRGRLGQVVDLGESLGHALADVADALVERELLGEALLQLDPLDLGPLIGQDPEADGDVRRVAGEVGDTLREGADVVGHVRHDASCLVR